MTLHRRLIGLSAAFAMALAACGGDDDSASEGPASAGEDARAEEAATDLAGDGWCHVSVTGDQSAEWGHPLDASMVTISHWFDAAQREYYDDEFRWIVNCLGEGHAALSMSMLNDVTAEHVPMAPGTYTLFGTAAAGAAEGNYFGVILNLDGVEVVWKVSEPGTITISEFDESRLKFTIDASWDDATAPLGTEGGAIELHAEFTIFSG